MDEEIEILTDEELVDTFSDNAFKQYMRDISKYPLLNIEEQKRLTYEYQKGDMKARELLINSNLRLVVSVANHYRSVITNMNILDIIQEGNLGLMKAIDNYDPEISAFSTYAVYWIRQAITRAIANKDAVIRKPVHITYSATKYKKLLEKYKSEGKTPSDKEICETLNITQGTLDSIRDSIKQVPVSINQKVDDDSDTELENFIVSENNDYEDVLNNIVNDTLLITLKEILPPVHYFILYYRVLNGETLTLEEVASYFNLTRERIRQIESKVLKKLKPYMQHNSKKIATTYRNIVKVEGANVHRIKKEPINPNKIMQYLYIRDELEYLEERIFYYEVFSKYYFTLNDLANELGVTVKEIQLARDIVKLKLKRKMSDIEKYREFREETIKTYGTKIFNIDLTTKVKKINYRELSNKYSNLSLEEILNLFKKIKYELTNDEIKLLTRYFGLKERNGIKEEELVIDINTTLFGFKHQDMHVPKNKLYEEYLKIKYEFDEEQQLFLETYYFGKKDRKVFQDKYPESSLYYRHYFLIDRLERSYYHILRFFENTFTKEMYLEVKKKYAYKFTDLKIKILDMYYGVDGRIYSLKEIASIIGLDYIKTHDLCRDARNYAIKLYSGLDTYRLDIDPDIYRKYIIDPKYYFIPLTRDILDMYILQKLSYDEISNKTKLSKTRISNIITEAKRKMDNYRFGLVEVIDIDENKINEFLKYYKDKISQDELIVIRYRYLKYMMPEEISSTLKIDINIVKRALTHFNYLYTSYLIKDVEVTNEDIIKEINKHVSESILSYQEKQFASYYLGIKNEYNIEGHSLKFTELMAKMELTNHKYWHKYMGIVRKIKCLKKGIIKPDLLFISREELNKLLDDCHLPISDKEKEIICYLFELKGYPYKELDEIAKIYNDTSGSIRRRYQRAIVSIYKYLNGELEGQIDYELDIIPLLRYFSISDRYKLEDFYKNGLSYEQMAKKYGATFSQIVDIMNRIKVNVYELLNNLDKTKVFDFDYYQEAIKNPDLPFYGDLDMAVKIFNLVFGMNGEERKSVPTIIEELHLDLKTTTVNRVVWELMLSVCKLKDGVTKEQTFSLEEVYSYYLKKHKEMPYYHKVYYLRYFKRITDNRNINGTKEKLSYYIINDLIEDIYPDAFSFKKATREEVIAILKKHYHELKKTTRNELMAIYEIREREFMSGREINHIFKLLDTLESKRKELNDHSLKLDRK